MSDIVRFTVSVEGDLLEAFDEYCAQQEYATRSEAVRQLIRNELTVDTWAKGSEDVAGTLTLVYDHHRAQIGRRLTKIQHDNTEHIVSTTHIHLNHDFCLEVIILRGPARRLQKIAAELKGLKGIFKGELVMASASDTGL